MLSAASSSGFNEVVLLLLEKGANVNAEGAYVEYALTNPFFCVRTAVRFSLKNEADFNAESGPHSNALWAASSNGHKKIEQVFLGNALSAASYNGHEKVVQVLLENGANVNAHGGRALWAASKNHQDKVMRLLLKNEADPNLVFQYHCKKLQGTSVDDHERVVRLLLEEQGYKSFLDTYLPQYRSFMSG